MKYALFSTNSYDFQDGHNYVLIQIFEDWPSCVLSRSVDQAILPSKWIVIDGFAEGKNKILHTNSNTKTDMDDIENVQLSLTHKD